MAEEVKEYTRVTKDGFLELRVKLGEGKPSSTGKSLVVASTGGFTAIDGGLKVNLTVIKPKA